MTDLKDIVTKYGVPDPSIVGKLPRGGIQLDFVGHAEITKILIEIDPLWSWEPCAFDVNGRPGVSRVNDMVVMWGRLTVLGKSLLGVGSAKFDKQDLDKELIGDFLRNASMRFGVALSLWSKAEWEHEAKPSKPVDADPLVSEGNKARIVNAFATLGIELAEALTLVGIRFDEFDKLRESGREKLLKAFNHAKDEAQSDQPVTETSKPRVDATITPIPVPDKAKSAHPSNGGGDIPPKITTAQTRTLVALCHGKGWDDEETYDRQASTFAGRTIKTFKDMSTVEADGFIKYVKGLGDGA